MAPAGYFTGYVSVLHGKQVFPDKKVNFPYVGKRGTRLRHASFTVSPVPWASTCCAALPRDSALYDVSVRQLTNSESRSSLTYTPAFFRPCLTATPLLSVSTLCYASQHYIGTRTGDLNPISSRPCRAYTIKSSRRKNSAAG